jgi:tetratricopeptide (TPR) repeat protein
VLNSLGVIAGEQQELAKAQSLFEASLALQRELGQNSAAQLNNLGMMAYFRGDYIKAKDYFEESLQIERNSHNLGLIATGLCSLAWAEGQLGNWEMALAHYVESLRLHQEVGGKEGIAYALEGLAGYHVSGKPGDEDPYLAARLLGAAAKLRKAIGTPLSPVEARDSQHATELARTYLGETVFQSAWQEGETTSIEALIQELLL